MWVLFAALVVIAVYYATQAVPEQPKVKPGTIQSPTSTEGNNIPKLFGTRDITAVNITGFANPRAVAIKKSGGKK